MVLESTGTADATAASAGGPSDGQAPATPSSVTPPSAPAATAPATSGSAPAAPAPGLFKDVAEAETRYKGLQREHDRLTKELAALAPYGDLRQIGSHLQTLQSLAKDEEILALLKAREAKTQTGRDDPETVAAIQLVEQLATQKAQELVAPLQAKELDRTITSLFGEMSKAHPGWDRYRGPMKELLDARVAAGVISPAVHLNPTYEVLEDLYLSVAARDPNWRRETYEREHLAAKRSAAVQASPGTAPASAGSKPAGSLEEAFANAKARLGLA